MELIDKSKLLEELKRCEKICEDYMSSHKDAVNQGIANAKKAVCQHFIKFIDTLETKGVDFEKEHKDMDEKIRQYLLWLVKPLWEDTIDSVGLKKDDIIAWIEKK